MAFPPEFSSTLTYANRYDLDEIDVFLEGDSNNPMFFNISGLPENLSFGKHFFYISLLNLTDDFEYSLRQNSKILFEFKSINNVVLRSDVLKINQQNGVATCFVDVLKDPLRTDSEIEDGQGTLTIVGSLVNNNNTRNPIPKKFIGAINYRCIFPINIRKNLVNADSPKVLQSEHKIETILGQFSFVKANITTNRASKTGTSYNSSTGQSQTAASAGPTGIEGTD